jgi:cytochrome c-type biogenesis protein CcmF
MGVPIGLALLFLLGVGPALPWGKTTRPELRGTLVPPLVGAALVSIVGWMCQVRNPWTIVTLGFGGYAAQVTLGHLWRLRHGRGRMGSYIVHAGVVIVVIAVAVSSTMQVSREIHLRRGQTADIGSYTLTFLGARAVKEVNRESIVADISVDRAGSRVGALEPRMNFYPMSQEPIGTPAVRTMMAADLYVSVLNIGAMGQEITIHALINPMVAWIWIATLVMAVGGVVSMVPSRRAVTGTGTSGAPHGARPREDAAGEHE